MGWCDGKFFFSYQASRLTYLSQDVGYWTWMSPLVSVILLCQLGCLISERLGLGSIDCYHTRLVGTILIITGTHELYCPLEPQSKGL